MKVGDRSVMQNRSEESITALYERLAPGRAIPAELENMPAIQSADGSTVPVATGPNEDVEFAESAQTAGDDIATAEFALTD
jgi:hypothetical protein